MIVLELVLGMGKHVCVQIITHVHKFYVNNPIFAINPMRDYPSLENYI